MVRETIEKYSILEGDIYNMDETVSCFVPLKHLYGQGMQEKMQYGIHSIGKKDFLQIYPAVHQQALSTSDIKSGIAETGLIPLAPDRALDFSQS